MHIDWMKCRGGVWCDLFKMNLDNEALINMNGVYIIWTGKDGSNKFLMVGEGNISEELKKARENLAIQAFRFIGVPVTFSALPEQHSSGAALFISNKIKPQIDYRVKKPIPPIRVNLPW